MKYFTQNLLARYRSPNQGIAEAAATEWHERTQSYRKRLESIRTRLPLSVRRFLRTSSLHDARLLTINFAESQGRTQFFLSFQWPDSDRQAGVQLQYFLVKPLQVILHDPIVAGDTILFALYDEFDALANGHFTHSILMTGGLEIQARFSRVVVTPFTKIIAPIPGRSDIKRQLAAMMG